jgi:glycosyltransferase involved in cell wall biosynthesis
MKHMPEHDDEAMRPDVSVVVPVYRSEACLEALVTAIDAALGEAGLDYEVILVNDGSPDRSWSVVESLCRGNSHVVGIDLRRNFGQDNAILTGLRVARGRAVTIMDDDLQHDPRDLPALLAKLEEDQADVVYADFRRKYQRPWKNLGSWFNGKVAEWVIDKPPGIYLSPYKVIRPEIAELISRFEGPEPYVDGLIFQVTTRITQVRVEHHERFAGRSNYTFVRSLRVWARLATSFSIMPLRLVTWCGFFLAALGVGLAVFVIGYRIVRPENFEYAVAGWASLMVTQLLTASARMVFLGVLGEYAGRTYMTVCHRPQAVIRLVLNSGSHREGAVRHGAGPGSHGG